MSKYDRYDFRWQWWRFGVSYHCANAIAGYKLLFWGGFSAEWFNLWWRIGDEKDKIDWTPDALRDAIGKLKKK